MPHDEPTNTDDVIDSRDIIARIEELEETVALWTINKRGHYCLEAGRREAEIHQVANSFEVEIDGDYVMPEGDEDATLPRAFASLPEAQAYVQDELGLESDDDAEKELKSLKALASEGENSCDDWSHGATLIRESYFTEYCQELVSDIGDMPKEIPSYIVIDWGATADNIRVDYSEIDFDGVTYLIR